MRPIFLASLPEMAQEAPTAPVTLAGKEVLVLRGRLERPTDGVQDYCAQLTVALRSLGVRLECAQMGWEDLGWLQAFHRLRSQGVAQRDNWILLQYTALAWSRHGFPFAAAAVAWILRRSGARVAVVFHEPCGLSGPRVIDRVRCACQDWTVKKLYRLALKGIFTVPLHQISWLPRNNIKAEFIPIGSNIPECFARPHGGGPTSDSKKTVAIFCLSQGENGHREAAEIVHAVRFVAKKGMPIRLSLVGKNSEETGRIIAEELEGTAEVRIYGRLPADEVSRVLCSADAFLFVYGMVSQRRGSALAGLACGLPIVGYAGAAEGTPLAEAGLLLAPYEDRQALAEALWRVLSDDALRAELQGKSRAAQRRYFSWNVIAGRFVRALAC